MDFIELIEKNWPILAGILLFILAIILVSAITAYRLCKRTYTELLDGAEGRVTIAEERASLTAERARMAEEQLSIMRRKLESMEPDAFDAKIDDVVSNIQEVEHSRLNGILRQLNELKVGESPSETVAETPHVEPAAAVVETVSETDTPVEDAAEVAVEAQAQSYDSINSDEITAAVKRNMTPA